MRTFHLYTEYGDFQIDNSELVEHLEYNGYKVIGDGVNSVDYGDGVLLDEIIQKFLTSNSFSREKIHKRVIKNEPFHDYNRMDMFDYLDQTGFDFLDNIDSQEMISHLENVGYKICEE